MAKHNHLCPRRQDPGPLGKPDPCQCLLIREVKVDMAKKILEINSPDYANKMSVSIYREALREAAVLLITDHKE